MSAGGPWARIFVAVPTWSRGEVVGFYCVWWGAPGVFGQLLAWEVELVGSCDWLGGRSGGRGGARGLSGRSGGCASCFGDVVVASCRECAGVVRWGFSGGECFWRKLVVFPGGWIDPGGAGCGDRYGPLGLSVGWSVAWCRGVVVVDDSRCGVLLLCYGCMVVLWLESVAVFEKPTKIPIIHRCT